jgi:CRISPR-associated protein Cas1
MLSEDGRRATTVEVRQLLAPRDDALPLYVQAQGAMVGKSGEVLEVRQREETLATARLLEISQVCLFGSVMVTAGALHELLDRGIPVCHFSHGGWFYGMTHGFSHKNVQLRLDQFRVAEDPLRSISVAKQMVSGKVRNCRTLLRRNHEGDITAALEELARILDLVDSTTTAESLLAMEGAAAKTYFAHFGGMFKSKDEEGATSFDFSARNRRPPVDPVNALLSFLYAILAKDTTVTLQSVGFDPMLGFFHRPRYGRPSLALDLMEEFRPLIVDSTVISLINNKEVVPSDFVRRAGAVAMNSDGRKKVLGAYERRMATEVTHPIFGYTVSYRRVLEVQARLLARHVMGEIPSYQPFCTR